MSSLRPWPSTQARLLLIQHDILEMVATGGDLRRAMDALCRRVERIVPDVICSILAVDADGRLQHLGSPSLPEAFAAMVDGVHAGPDVGSCGTAAFCGEPVETLDITTDPLWADYRDLPLPDGVRACWSNPIHGSDGRVIGTFAFYFRAHRGASDVEREILRACIHICAIAIEHEAAAAELRRLAYEDVTTGLMNRTAFQSSVAAAIEKAAREGSPAAIHYIDLDEFKGVNDTLGHHTGDLLLRAVAERLKAAVGDAGVVGRLGGDEFAVFQEAVDRESAADLAWRLLAAFVDPFRCGEREVVINASIGIALVPSDGGMLSDLLKNADLALYRAKANGRGRYEFFTERLADQALHRQAMAGELKQALDDRQFHLAYQPIVELASGATVCCEALLRWRHPVRGLVPTADFIRLAEELGSIAKIGDWVLRQACRQAARWPDDIAIAVNLSPVQLRSRTLADQVRAALEGAGLAAGRLVLEITETAILADEPVTRQVLLDLDGMGVRIALDDFGTGYSPLWALRTFPIDRIKIDRSFVRDLTEDKQSASIIRAIIALARGLGMATTAEGVETAEQAAILLAEGCTNGQGFHFARPMSADAILHHLTAEAASLQPAPPPLRAAVG